MGKSQTLHPKPYTLNPPHAGKGETPLHFAAAKGDHIMCKILGALGVDMQVANLDGNGPIHIAAEAGHAEAVRVFIDKGISPDTPGAGGQVVSPRGDLGFGCHFAL